MVTTASRSVKSKSTASGSGLRRHRATSGNGHKAGSTAVRKAGSATASKSSTAKARRKTTASASRAASATKAKAKRTTSAKARKTTASASATRNGTAAKAKAKRTTTAKARKTSSAKARKSTTVKAKARKSTAAKAKARKTTAPAARKSAAAKAKRTTSAKARKTSSVKAKARRTTTSAKRKTSAARTRKPASTTARKTRTATKPRTTPSVSPAVAERRQWLGLDSAEVFNASSLPSLPLEDFEVASQSRDAFEDTCGGSTTVGWLGIGQAGGRIAHAFHGLGYGKSFAINTCPHDLDGLGMPGKQKLLLDIGYDASGMNPARGQHAVEHYRQQMLYAIEHVFGQDVDHVMLAVGAGGAMGGATPAVIDTIRAAAKRIGLGKAKRKVGVVCTLPTHGEAASPQVRDNAYRLVTELTELARRRIVSPLVILDNEKIQRLYPRMTVKQFWPTVNTTAAGLFHMFNRLSAMPSPYTSFDPDNYRSIMQAGGCCVMGLTKVDKYVGRDDLANALHHDLDKTMLADGFDLTTAKQVGAIVVGGRRVMANTPGLQDLINRAFDVLTDLTGRATVHRGIYEDEKDSVRVYTMIGGLEPPAQRLEDLREME